MTSNGQATPFPRTPYPFDVVNPSQHTLPPISEWLEVQNEDEYHPEELALSPEEAVRNSDMTWPFGTPDWIAESAFTELPEPALCAECRASGTAASDGSYEVVDDCSSETSSLDVTSQIDHLPSSPTIPNDQQLLHNTASEGEPKMLAAAKGKTRPRSTEIDPVDQPANKRPRLDLNTQAANHPNPPSSFDPRQTPISPERHFTHILAERSGRNGKLYKVSWRDSWVHEASLPNVEVIRQTQSRNFGRAWEVLPEILEE